ncbi:import inner membrane translocase subunit tim44 [Anaeramoeba flamelloides]|uniref:Import inner membrane translocase subunit tim44 n=1 Tax=Anaeramoeba flamelloides TaxID=1746091 RepID=A0ABQ8YZ35_9EUKA|nr:import inner membrane translocase subunit tim44 [Anaeramoeba flamelloides]
MLSLSSRCSANNLYSFLNICPRHILPKFKEKKPKFTTTINDPMIRSSKYPLFPTTKTYIHRQSSLWTGLSSKIIESLNEDQEIKKTYERFKRRNTVKVLNKVVSSTLDYSGQVLSYAFYPFKKATQMSIKLIDKTSQSVIKTGTSLKNSDFFLARYSRETFNYVRRCLVNKPLDSQSHHDPKQNKGIKYKRNTLDFQTQEPQSTELVLLPDSKRTKLKNFWYSFSSSRNPVFTLFQKIFLIPKFFMGLTSKFVSFLLPENNMSICVREIRKVDPQFRFFKFNTFLEEGFIQSFMKPYLAKDIQKVKKYFDERLLLQFYTKLNHQSYQEKKMKRQLLFIRNVKLASCSTNQIDTLLYYFFEADELHTFKIKENRKYITKKETKNVSYYLVLKLDPELSNFNWKVVNLLQVKSKSWI